MTRSIPPFSFLGACVLLPLVISPAACSSTPSGPPSRVHLEAKPAAPTAGPPTVTRLILEMREDGLHVVEAVPRRDNPTAPDVKANLDRITRGEDGLYEVRLLSAAGALLESTLVLVPLKGEVEFMDPNQPHRIERQPAASLSQTVITVKVPYLPTAVEAELLLLQPAAENLDVKTWKRTSLGRVRLPQAQEPPR
jgi:hypothetical protein